MSRTHAPTASAPAALLLLAKKDLASGMSQGFSQLQSAIETLPAAVTALDELKTLVTSERDLELTLSWRVQRKGTKL